MDLTTCTAAAVTPYPSPIIQAQSLANFRPLSCRRPSRHAPQPPSLALSCLSRGLPAVRCPSPRKLSSNAHEHTPISASPHHSPSQPITRITRTAVHPISPKLSSNAHERSHNAHEHTPMPASPHHSPSSESRQLQCRQSHPNSRQTLTDAREHSQTLTPASNCPSRSFPQFPLTLLQLSASMAGPVAAVRTDPDAQNDCAQSQESTGVHS